MATENTLRYIKTDFQSHKDALLQRIRARWPKVWNDFLTSSFGIVIVDIVAYAFATLAFLINRQAAENYVPTMTLRESAVRIGALVNYSLRRPLPSTVSCEAVLSSTNNADVTIYKGTVIRTSGGDATPFEVASDYIIQAGSLTPRTTVLTISADAAGANVLSSFVSGTIGSSNLDVNDTTVDLTQYVDVGQSVSIDGLSDTYIIESIESAPDAVNNNRMVLSSPLTASVTSAAATIFDQRIVLIQGQTVTDSFTAPETETQLYAVRLSRTPVIEGSVVVVVSDETWVQYSSFVQASADANAYELKTYATGETVVIFGDGIYGRVAPTDAVIQVTYRIGGGISGNISKGSIQTSVTGLAASLSQPLQVTITNNYSSGIGGRDAETLEEARINIPYFARTNDRGVTLDDYQTLVSQYSSPLWGSVAYARSTIRKENSLLEGNVVVIYAWTTGSDGGLVNLTPQLKQALKDYLQTKAVGTDLVEIFDGTARPTPIAFRFKVIDGFVVSDVQNLVETTLKNSITSLRPGQTVVYSDLVRRLDEVYGVDTVDMATPVLDLVTSNTTELFTNPLVDYTYSVDRIGVGETVSTTDDGNIGLYVAQLPVYPVQSWCIRLFLGTNELTIVPSTVAGFAEIYGDNISTSQETESDTVKLFDTEPSLNFKSTVNLQSGQVRLWLKGAPGDLTMKLVPVQGYQIKRPVDVYIGYTGENTQTKRREIRTALRAWSDGLPIGGDMYAMEVAGVRASKSSVTSVVSSISSVTTVTRVALDTPANNEDKINAADYEILTLGNIVINNQID